MKMHKLVIWIFGILVSSGYAESTPEGENARFSRQVETLVQMLVTLGQWNTKAAFPVVAKMEVMVQNQAKLTLKREKGYRLKISAEQKASAARVILKDKFARIEDALTKGMVAEDQSLRLASLSIGARVLGLSKIEPLSVERFKKISSEVPENLIEKSSAVELFALSEALAFFGRHEGEQVLLSVMKSPRADAAFKRRAIRAGIYLGSTDLVKAVVQESRSADATVAFTALDFLEVGGASNAVLGEASIEQLGIFSQRMGEGTPATPSDHLLIGRVSILVIFAARDKKLSTEYIKKAKDLSSSLLASSDLKIQEKAASLFSEFCGPADLATANKLLYSESAYVRGRGAFSIAKMGKKAVMKSKARLLILLEDDTAPQTQRFALMALLRGLGEPSSSHPGEKEFNLKKAYVITHYRQ